MVIVIDRYNWSILYFVSLVRNSMIYNLSNSSFLGNEMHYMSYMVVLNLGFVYFILCFVFNIYSQSFFLVLFPSLASGFIF